MLLLGSFFLAIQIGSVQTWLAKRLTAYLSTELNATVSIERVKIRFIKSVVLEKLFVADQHGDTLIYADEFVASIDNFSSNDRVVDIGKVTLADGQFNLIHYRGEPHDNLYFLTDYFSTPDTTSTGRPWKFTVDAFDLKNMQFVSEVQDDSAATFGVDFSHLKVSRINGRFRNFHVMNDSIFVKIEHLSFFEKSGFKVDEFAADAKVSSTQIRLKDLAIRSDHSNINGDLTFDYDSFPDFDEFTHNIRWNATFRQSTISFSDIAFFASDLKGWNKHVQIDGTFKGTVNRFRGRNVKLAWGDKSFFRGNVSMNGLPVWEETYMDILADEVQTDKNDIEWIQFPPFDSGDHIVVPENLAHLGTVHFKGKFTGFANDFVAYGSFNTAIGMVNSDLNLKYVKDHASYKGHLSTLNFDIGKIAQVKDLGNVTFSADVKGSGLQLNNINASLKGKVESIVYRKYPYRNILIDGQIAKRLFNGSFIVNDPNADLEFSGTIDYRKELPEFDFVADIRSVYLDSLNLFELKGTSRLQTTIQTHFIGNKPDNLVGSILIDNTNFLSNKKLYHLNTVSVRSDKTGNSRSIEVHSDLLEADFDGEFEFATLPDAFKEIIPRFLPSVVLPKKAFVSNQNFNFDIRLKNMNLISELFLPSWDVSPNTSIVGRFNSINHDFHFDLNSDYIRYKTFDLTNISTMVDAGQTELQVDVKSVRLLNKEKPFIELPELKAVAKQDKVDFILKLADQDTFPNRAHIEGNVRFFSSQRFDLHIDSSFLVVQNQQWKMNKDNLLRFDTTAIAISGLQFYKSGQEISFDGKITRSPDELLKLHLDNFDLDNLNPLLRAGNTKLGGIVSGDLALKDVYNDLQVQTDLSIAGLSLNNDTLGNAMVKMQYKGDKSVIGTKFVITRGSVNVIDISGDYYLSKPDENLDMTVRLNNFYLHTLERYMEGIVTDVHGKVSSDLKLTGSFDKPAFNGTVDFVKTSLIVDYLKTRYSFTSTIEVKENEFVIDGLKLVDVNNNEAVANGSVFHDYFRNFRFDLNLKASRFQVMNTALKDNSLYYGLANASGFAHFYGPLETMSMDISLSPDKGTVINIPLNTSSELVQSDFVTFVDRHRDTTRSITRTQVNLSGIRLNMNLDMNPNAMFNIIFDEKIGDVISGSGKGSLRLDINTAGAFNMYGNYIIDRGDYLFTLQNLINKKFTIEPGGRISWAGDPYEATVDLSAVYVVYTSSLYNVLPDSSYKRRLPVDCRLFLSNKLMNPTITYEINVRGLDPTAQGVVKTILNNEQEINKQMFGLLVLNQFVPPNAAGQVGRLDAGAGAGASASELLSNQVSNWLGQLSKDVNIGLNYRAADTYSSEEVQLMFSKTLLNDRLTLEGNVGYLNNQNPAAVSTASGNSNVVGDFYAEWKLNEDGRLRVKGFNRSNAGNIITYSQSPYTQGLGLFYRQEFNSFQDLLIKWRLIKKQE